MLTGRIDVSITFLQICRSYNYQSIYVFDCKIKSASERQNFFSHVFFVLRCYTTLSGKRVYNCSTLTDMLCSGSISIIPTYAIFPIHWFKCCDSIQTLTLLDSPDCLGLPHFVVHSSLKCNGSYIWSNLIRIQLACNINHEPSCVISCGFLNYNIVLTYRETANFWKQCCVNTGILILKKEAVISIGKLTVTFLYGS
jgi:hypothetical protein